MLPCKPKARACVHAGSLYCWGANYVGQLGLDDTTDRSTPTLVDDSHTWVQVALGTNNACALDDAGQVLCFGDGGRGQLGDGRNVSRPTLAPACFPP